MKGKHEYDHTGSPNEHVHGHTDEHGLHYHDHPGHKTEEHSHDH